MCCEFTALPEHLSDMHGDTQLSKVGHTFGTPEVAFSVYVNHLILTTSILRHPVNKAPKMPAIRPIAAPLRTPLFLVRVHQTRTTCEQHA